MDLRLKMIGMCLKAVDPFLKAEKFGLDLLGQGVSADGLVTVSLDFGSQPS
jgi:hypothetical protein